MIVLADLHERPLVAEAAQNRSLVDEVLAVFPENSGEAWRVLRRARAGAQQMAAKWACLEDELGNMHGEMSGVQEEVGVTDQVFDWPDWDRVFGFGEEWVEEA